MGQSIKVQVNVKHKELPAMKILSKTINSFIYDICLLEEEEVRFDCSSPEDLFADKIIASAASIGTGREKFKDVYDMGMLLTLNLNFDLVFKKIEYIAEKRNPDSLDVLKSSKDSITNIMNEYLSLEKLSGPNSIIVLQSRFDVKKWHEFCNRIIKILEEIDKKDVRGKILSAHSKQRKG